MQMRLQKSSQKANKFNETRVGIYKIMQVKILVKNQHQNQILDVIESHDSGPEVYYNTKYGWYNSGEVEVIKDKCCLYELLDQDAESDINLEFCKCLKMQENYANKTTKKFYFKRNGWDITVSRK